MVFDDNLKRTENKTSANNLDALNNPPFVQQGWQCPICKRVYSPITPMCWYCGNNVTKTSNDTSVVEIKDKEIKDKVIRIAANKLGIEGDNINEQDTIEKLGADSLDIVELSLEFEQEFGIEFPDEAWDTVHTIGEIIEFIEENRTK